MARARGGLRLAAFGTRPRDSHGLETGVAVYSVDEDGLPMDFGPRLVDAKDRSLIQLFVRVVRRIRVALGGIDEDAVLVSHADRLGLPPEQPS